MLKQLVELKAKLLYKIELAAHYALEEDWEYYQLTRLEVSTIKVEIARLENMINDIHSKETFILGV